MVDRTYGQFCAIARSLDVVGDRWTLLVVRELLRGPRTFASLEASLHGISSTLLSERLTRLRTDGLVVRNDAPQRSKAVTYALTELGAGLEPVLFALLRWGGWSMVRGQGDDHVDPEWSGLALKALLDGTAGPPPPTDPRDDATVHVSVDGVTTTVHVHAGRRSVEYGAVGQPDATVTADFLPILAVASGLLPVDGVVFAVEGDETVVAVAVGAAASGEA